MADVLNAFQAVRPRGATPLSAQPHKSARIKAPGQQSMLLDRNGVRCVPIGPRASGAIAIEPREQAAASVERRRSISKGGTK